MGLFSVCIEVQFFLLYLCLVFILIVKVWQKSKNVEKYGRSKRYPPIVQLLAGCQLFIEQLISLSNKNL